MIYIKDEVRDMKILMIRGFYGINIHSDSQGDLGSTVYDGNVNPDLGFIMAATIAHNVAGNRVDIIDAIAENRLADDMLETLKKDHVRYDYIFIKASAPTVRLDIDLAVKLKQIFPEAKLCFAGHIAKLLKTWIDNNVKCMDEAIEIPLDFYMYQLVNKTDCVDVDKFPCPDYSLFPYQKYLDQKHLRLALQASRGCNMGCKYCPYNAFYEDKMYFYNIEKVIRDMKMLCKLEPEILLFRDQFFTADRERIKCLCKRMIQEGITVRWTCETRIEFLDEELMDLMIDAGMCMICFGVESGDPAILKQYNRNFVDDEEIAYRVDYLNRRGVLTLGFYIIGFPEETWETAQLTFQRALKLGSTIAQFSPYEPCVMSEERRKSLTPEDFYMYKNTMKMDEEYALSPEEITYLIDSFATIYNYKNGELQNNYFNEVRKKKEHLEMIDHLLKCGNNLESVCQTVRNNYMGK